MRIGRFAPSPTGPLHLGSLVAAAASYCDAKSHDGKWLLRIEDVDQTRKMAGASEEIIHTLEHYGFVWDDEVIYQSQRTALYEEALTRLRHKDLAYRCTCSRKEIADSSTMHGIEGAIYPGTCLAHPIKHDSMAAWRLKTTESLISFQDLVQGRIQHNMAWEIGDFVIKRSDGLYSYQLAVVVDDALQGVTHVVRGADLLNSTTRQIYLQQLLGYSTPVYAHIPLVLNADGQKLSKQTLARSLPKDEVIPTLLEAFSFLPYLPTPPRAFKTLPELWQWALENWQPFDSVE
ncbi:MAG TPA: tRNA glutamyl-Q(34) synthetase GluQRS [Methylophilus sp.]|uniref:tRNA glutamyl-Q(34) synthetase GluQRS n=1 Tax=Methylophilus sp. TaxID=29541 RepID=UPI002CBD1155|nr:tRNA glutamyl-Q(34) synthetase GluQRS [Methylophilus sp.]HSH86176.1 tRNA glutamyl-Q(34) synthetase GluQRS [Methylophilus sp.]